MKPELGGFTARLAAKQPKTVEQVLIDAKIYEGDGRSGGIKITEEAGKKLFGNQYNYQEAGGVLQAAETYAKEAIVLTAAKNSGIDVTKQMGAARKTFEKAARFGGVDNPDTLENFTKMLTEKAQEQVSGKGR